MRSRVGCEASRYACYGDWHPITQGMANRISRAFYSHGAAAVLTLSVVGLIALAWFGYRTAMAGVEQAESAYSARSDVFVVFTDLLDQETGLRGYTSTNDRSFLTPYIAARSRIHADLRSARQAVRTANALVVEPSLLDIESKDTKWLDETATPLIAQPNRGNASELQSMGKMRMDQMRADVDIGLHDLDEKTASNSIRTKRQLELGQLVAVLIGVVLCSVILIVFRSQQRTAVERDNDIMTGLPNRGYFLPQTERALSAARRLHTDLVLVLLDLNGFKAVNDVHGHSAGDELLRAVAQRLRSTIRETDLVARLGGDEFTVLLQAQQGTLDVDLVLRKIQACVAEPSYFHDHEVRVTASVGVARYPQDGDTPEALLASADHSMYRAKRLHAAAVFEASIVGATKASASAAR